MIESDELLSGAELARRLGVPPNTVYSWRRKNILPYCQVPGMAPRYRLRDVTAILERHRKGPDIEVPSSTERR